MRNTNTDHFICGNTFRCVWALREYLTSTKERKIISNAASKNRMPRMDFKIAVELSMRKSGVL